MRDRSHNEQVVRWAEFVRDNPFEIWKPEIKKIVDSQIMLANDFYKRLAKTKNGKEKIKELRGI